MSYKEIKFQDGSYRREWRNASCDYHREDGPAVTYHYPDGSTKHEFFCLNGALHRELGPAEIRYDPDGSIVWEDFYFNGVLLGKGKKGFWVLWDGLTDDKRRSPEILKCLARFS